MAGCYYSAAGLAIKHSLLYASGIILNNWLYLKGEGVLQPLEAAFLLKSQGVACMYHIKALLIVECYKEILLMCYVTVKVYNKSDLVRFLRCVHRVTFIM